MLKITSDAIYFAVLFKFGTGLLKMKGNALLKALVPNIQHPAISANAGAVSGFTANDDLINGRRKIGAEVNRF